MQRRQLAFRIATVLWMGLIFYLSTIPDLKSSLPSVLDLVARKAAHFLEFGVLFLLARESFGGPSRNVLAAVLAVAYAISDEYHQGFVAGRSPSPIDVLIDSAGVLTAFLALRKRPPTQA